MGSKKKKKRCSQSHHLIFAAIKFFFFLNIRSFIHSFDQMFCLPIKPYANGIDRSGDGGVYISIYIFYFFGWQNVCKT